MRCVWFVLFVLNPLVVFAAPTDYFSAVLASEGVKALTSSGSELVSIKNTKTFRCLGCFEFTLTIRADMETPTGVRLVETEKVVNTVLQENGHIKVSAPKSPTIH